MVLNENLTLSNGVKIPKLGLGTWFVDDDKAADAVCAAVKWQKKMLKKKYIKVLKVKNIVRKIKKK